MKTLARLVLMLPVFSVVTGCEVIRFFETQRSVPSYEFNRIDGHWIKQPYRSAYAVPTTAPVSALAQARHDLAQQEPRLR